MAADTDMQVMDILDLAGEVSAGQLADLMGMTTGATARILNRLEEAGLVRRERDPNDGRRVIVRLEKGKDEMHKVHSTLTSLEKTWEEAVSRYDEEQLAFLLEFLQRSNVLSRKELVKLQEVSPDEGKIFSAPLGDLAHGRLVVSSCTQLTLRASEGRVELYQARFEGSLPNVAVKDGVVTIRYPRLDLIGVQHQAVVMLSRIIPWQIVIQSGGTAVTAELGGLDLASLEIKGGGSQIHLELPMPSGVIPIKISGGGSEILIRRPAGVAVQAHFKGWGSACIFDDQTHRGNNLWLRSSGFDPTAPYYNIEVASSGSVTTITSD
ncbi:MarR family transcriptional regulator [Ktedonosporobacter rubrisoli]|uniref:MarR family transcriptional regulator n=2 Tax=Ktedonosporobacter rubrisoli TaxID=2509675 RepID=A0A4P6K5Y0_KTERU|nr:MarR family transcriptional regulator [Ktedonosporobacter rubrisoli]